MKNVDGKRILIVTGDFVYPPNHGGRVDVWNRLTVLHEMGFWIHLICTVKQMPEHDNIEVVRKIVQRLDLSPRRNRIIDMIYKEPLQMVSRKSLKDVKLDDYYDFALLEGTYVWKILSNPAMNVHHLILRMHNNEYVYFNALAKAEHSWLRKIYYLIESKKFYQMDAKIVRRIPNILFISHKEKEKYENSYKDINGCFLPASVKLDFKHQKRDKNIGLLVASFFMENNREAILFYLREIHPLIKIPGYQIIIAGNSRGESIDWIIHLARNYDNVQIYDSPNDLQPLYDRSSVFINSMLHGAGVKLKTINAVVEGLPVVSTTIGNEGTGLYPGRDIIVEDDAENIAKEIVYILQNKDKADVIVRNAQEYIKNHYNQRKVIEEYFSKLES